MEGSHYGPLGSIPVFSKSGKLVFGPKFQSGSSRIWSRSDKTWLQCSTSHYLPSVHCHKTNDLEEQVFSHVIESFVPTL